MFIAQVSLEYGLYDLKSISILESKVFEIDFAVEIASDCSANEAYVHASAEIALVSRCLALRATNTSTITFAATIISITNNICA